MEIFKQDSFVQEYNHFIEEHPETFSPSLTDFFGINISDYPDAKPTFKIYYTPDGLGESDAPFLKPLYQLQMIKNLNLVFDSINKGKLRCEIGLAKRNNRNMESLMEWLRGIYAFMPGELNEIAQFSKIKCSDCWDYSLAALYFLGFIAKTVNGNISETEAVKLHYILRNCDDPDHLGRNYRIDEKVIFHQLESVKIPLFQNLLMLLSEFLERSCARFWIAAVDFYRHSETKYKIYVNCLQPSSLAELAELLYSRKILCLSQRVRDYSEWLKSHPEFAVYGLAICISSNKVWSLNFYHTVKPPDSQSR